MGTPNTRVMREVVGNGPFFRGKSVVGFKGMRKGGIEIK